MATLTNVRPLWPCFDGKCFNPWHTTMTCYHLYLEMSNIVWPGPPTVDQDTWAYLVGGGEIAVDNYDSF